MANAEKGNTDDAAINLNEGPTPRRVTDTIVSENNLQMARERIQKRKDEGTTVRERLNKLKKRFISTKMTIDARHYHFDETVLEHMKGIAGRKNDLETEKRRKDELDYMKKCAKADAAERRNKCIEDVKGWNNFNDVKAYLQPLKVEGVDKKWPT